MELAKYGEKVELVDGEFDTGSHGARTGESAIGGGVQSRV